MYSDGCIVLIGDSVRSYDTDGPRVYEGTVVGITSTSILCYPPYECQLNFGTCDQIYLVNRSSAITQQSLSQLDAITPRLRYDAALGSPQSHLRPDVAGLEHRRQR